MSEAEFIFRSMKTHQVLIIVVDTRILSCVADSLQERRFASISPTDHKNTKASIFRSKLIGIKVAHGRCGLVKRTRRNHTAPLMISLAQWHVPSKTDSLATLLWSYVHPIRPGRRRNMECTNLLHGLWMSVSYFFHLPKLWAMALMECLYQSHPSRDHIGSFPSFILNHGSRRSSHLR